MSSSSLESPTERQPLWVTVSASAIRSLPFGRYRAANAVARLSQRPFLSRMPADLGGASFACDLSDSIAREVCFTGRYEPQETQIARSLLRPGMQVIDVGANWGYFTLVAAHLVQSHGRVLALEPHPGLFATLSANVTRNGLRHVACVRVAASDGPGCARFVAPVAADGNSGLSRLACAHEPGDFDSPTEAVDHLVDRLGADVVDLVKIDVEGAEARVLRGMADRLRRARYRFVLLECHPQAANANGTTLDDCIAILRDGGYQGWHIDHSPAMHRRSAAGPVAMGDMLTPCRGGVGAHRWPHLLWAAPGETVPA
jgi:FkbM family methyltransferase